MGYKIVERRTPVCIECGDRIRYGRSDKKFCCDSCKSAHHNRVSKASRNIRRKIQRMLNRNYEILDSLLKADVTASDMMELMSMGFTPGLYTSCRKHVCRQHSHNEYVCFDIKYRMTMNRVSCISKLQNVSVPLQCGPELNE